MCSQRTLILPLASTSEYGEVAEAFFQTVRESVTKELQKYRALRSHVNDLANKVRETDNRIRNNDSLIRYYSERFDKMNYYLPFVAFFTLLMLLLSLWQSSFVVLFFAFLVATVYIYIQSSEARNQIIRIGHENEMLRRQLADLSVRLQKARDELNNFRLPKIKMEAYKMYVPVGFWEFDGHLVALSSYAEGVPVEVKILTSGDEVAKIAGDVARLNQFYRDLFLKEKIEGKSIVEALIKLNLWERVVSFRSPERLIAEEISKDVQRMSGVVQEWRGFLPLVVPEEKNVKFFKESLSKSIEGPRPFNVVEEAESSLSESINLLEELKSACDILNQVEDFVREAREILTVAEGYKDVFERFLELTKSTVPLEPPLGVLRKVYCRRCTDIVIDEAVSKLDLLRWIDINILGGVSEDSDIVVAPEKVRDEVKRYIEDIRLLVFQRVPLLGLNEIPEDVEEAVKAYYEGLRRYAVGLSGGDEGVVLSQDKLSGENTLKCEKCGVRLDSNNTYYESSIVLPYAKAYFALLFEYIEKLFTKSETIRLSVNNARLSKDQRKTALGIYENMVHEFENRREGIVREIQELNRYETSLLTTMSLLGISEAVLEGKRGE
jgi:hypothetical protein